MKAEAKQRCDAVPQTGVLTGLHHAPTSGVNNLAASEGQPGSVFVPAFVHARPVMRLHPATWLVLIASALVCVACGVATLIAVGSR